MSQNQYLKKPQLNLHQPQSELKLHIIKPSRLESMPIYKTREIFSPHSTLTKQRSQQQMSQFRSNFEQTTDGQGTRKHYNPEQFQYQQQSSLQRLSKIQRKISRQEKFEIDDAEKHLVQVIKRARNEQDHKLDIANFVSLKNQEEYPKLFIMNLPEGEMLRGKVRDFFGSRLSSELFDNIDDLSKCMTDVQGYAKQVANKIQRKFIQDGVEKWEIQGVEEFDRQQVQKLKNFSIMKNIDLQKAKSQQGVPSFFISKYKQMYGQLVGEGASNIKDKKANFTIQKPRKESAQNIRKESQQQTNSNNKIQAKKNNYLHEAKDNQAEQEKDELGSEQFDKDQQEQKKRQREIFGEFHNISQKLSQYKDQFQDSLLLLDNVRRLRANQILLKSNVATQKSNNENYTQLLLDCNTEDRFLALAELQNDPSSYLKRLQRRFRLAIWSLIYKLKSLGLTVKEIIQNQVFSNHPFAREGSSQFFFAVKEGNFDTVRYMLSETRYHVFDFDCTRQTPLHWAVRRNQFEIANLLIQRGADLEAHDMAGRTPLFIAAKNENPDLVRLLLMNGADPLARSLAKKRVRDFTQSKGLQRILEVAEHLHIFKRLVPAKNRSEFWQRHCLPTLVSGTTSAKVSEKFYERRQNAE